MKTVRKTFITFFVTAFSVAFALLLTVLVAAACSERVTLRFETGGGTYLASVEGSAGGTYQKPCDPEKEGYFFDGWYSDPSYTGGKLALPDVLPSESVTYYAKYIRCPVLTLDAGEGLAETEHRVRPGTDLLTYLSDFVPKRDGLVFGGWELGGSLLTDGAEMTEEDMRLTARYKAEYDVCVYLQEADDPLRYEKSAELSYTGADWLGEEFTAKPPALGHFLYDADASVPSAQLHAGENRLELYFSREALNLHIATQIPGGGQIDKTVASRYGAHIALDSPACPDGYAFFGWSDGEREYGGGETLTLERDLDLTGGWGKLYPNVRGEGSLAVEVGEGDRRAEYFSDGGRVTGRFFSENNTFVAGEYRGRLAIGGFLPDDSGRYTGTSLAKRATGELGVLTLDFSKGAATYSAPLPVEGLYYYDYDETLQAYTGDYVFSSGGLSFRFRLGEGTFLRQGKEKNSYANYDPATGGMLPDSLSLDGYGGGVWKKDGHAAQGSYRGEGKEWEFTPSNGDPFTVLLGERVWSDGEDLAGEQAFLYYKEELAGEYPTTGGTLSLDGYGLRAVYRTAEGETAAPFSREGNLVTLHAPDPLRFTLTGEGCVETGEEYGVYRGEKGTLFLDGAGGATLSADGTSFRGSYRREGEDWRFAGEEGFLFRLSEEGYTVFDEQLAGSYRSEWGLALELDGYGGAVYHNLYGGKTALRVGYADDTLLLLSGEELLTRFRFLSLTVDRGAGTVRENPSMTAGVFPVLGGEGALVLDGAGNAVLSGGQKTVGTYTLSGTTDVICAFGGTAACYRISEESGAFCCKKANVSGEFFCGGSALVLDGYGRADYRGELGEFSAAYTLSGGVAEVAREKEIWRFTLGEKTFTLTRYSVYRSPDGSSALLLQREGKSAICRTETDCFGMYSEDGLFLGSDREFSFRLYGEEYRVYDRSQEAVYRVEGGGTLSFDGCGLGIYTAADGTEYTGEAAFTDGGLAVFTSGKLPLSGMAGFRLTGEGTLEKLSGEFGLWTSAEGSLFLLGDGSARLLRGGLWETGKYERIADGEYTFTSQTASFRFRVEEGGKYRVYSAALAAYAGEYKTGEGTLVVDGYGARLGERNFLFVCGGEGGFIAREEGTEGYFAVRTGQNATLTSASSRYCV